jgi:tetratricopeptide (TPR) repeat protein
MRLLEHARRVGSKRGDLHAALRLHEESLELARTVDDAWLVSVATNNLGIVHSSLGDHARAAELYEESLAIGEARGDLERRARQLHNLADARASLGDGEGALELYRRGLIAAVEVGAVGNLVEALSGIAYCVARAGDPVVAARLFGRSDALWSSLGPTWHNEEEEETLAILEAALGPDCLEAELAAGAAMSQEDAIRLALGPDPAASPGM